jgi:hypothetical protein
MARNTNTTETIRPNNLRDISDAEIDRSISKMGNEVKNEPRVPVFIAEDPNAEKQEPQYASVNGYPFWIPRGREVYVPYSVYTILQQQRIVR